MALPPALAFELTDLADRLTAVQGRITAIEAELVRVAEPLPAAALLRTIPGVGPTVAAILVPSSPCVASRRRERILRKRPRTTLRSFSRMKPRCR